MTPNEIITAAFAKNRKNQPGVLASGTEMFSSFLRVYPVMWTIGARVNPGFFGARATVPFETDGWARPAEAESVFRIELPNGDLVNVVPMDERDADPFVPALYEWGQRFYPAGNPDDPESGNLVFWYAKKPTLPVTADTELEALWPASFDELLVLELALVLAAKDQRADEIALLRGDRDVWLRRFIAHLEHATVGVTRSTGAAQRFQAATQIPLTTLLTGGTDVQL